MVQKLRRAGGIKQGHVTAAQVLITVVVPMTGWFAGLVVLTVLRRTAVTVLATLSKYWFTPSIMTFPLFQRGIRCMFVKVGATSQPQSGSYVSPSGIGLSEISNS